MRWLLYLLITINFIPTINNVQKNMNIGNSNNYDLDAKKSIDIIFKAESEILVMTKAQDGTIYLGTEKGILYKKNYNDLDFVKIFDCGKTISAIIIDINNTIIVGSENGNFIKYNDSSYFQTIDNIRGFIIRNTQDSQGTIYIICNSFGAGYYYQKELNNPTFKKINGIKGLASTITCSETDTIYMGTINGKLYKKQKKETDFTLTKDFGNKNNVIITMKIDADETIWIGTINGIIYKKAKNDVDFINFANVGGTVFTIAFDKNGTVWTGNLPGELYRKTKDELTFTRVIKLNNGIVNIIARETDELIIGSGNKIYKYIY